VTVAGCLTGSWIDKLIQVNRDIITSNKKFPKVSSF